MGGYVWVSGGARFLKKNLVALSGVGNLLTLRKERCTNIAFLPEGWELVERIFERNIGERIIILQGKRINLFTPFPPFIYDNAEPIQMTSFIISIDKLYQCLWPKPVISYGFDPAKELSEMVHGIDSCIITTGHLMRLP